MSGVSAVETKVQASTAATFAVSLLAVLLNAVVGNSQLLNPLPAWLQPIVIALVPAAITFLSGWQASHTPRGPVSGS